MNYYYFLGARQTHLIIAPKNFNVFALNMTKIIL